MNRHDSSVLKEVEKQRQLKIPEKVQLDRDRNEYKQKVKKDSKEQKCSKMAHPAVNSNARAAWKEPFLMPRYPTDPDLQNEIAEELYKWVMKDHPNSYPKRLDAFAIANNLNFYHFRQMCATNNFFREIYEFCGNVVSQQVYNNWEAQKICKDYARDFLFEHDRTFAERHHRLTVLKNQEQQERPKQIVEVMEIRNCPEVPERVKDDVR